MSGGTAKERAVAAAKEIFSETRGAMPLKQIEAIIQAVCDAGRKAGIEEAVKEIVTSTGPTGGWLDSPKAVAAAIRRLAE